MSSLVKPSRRSVLIGGAAALGTLSLGAPAIAQAGQWPRHPVKFIVPFSAGGTTDLLARLVAQRMSEEYGQQFIVENKPGAGGNIAGDFVAKADPDGYTFIVGTPGTHSINKFVFKAMNYDQINDIAPVIIIATVPNLFSVTNDLPVKSVAEFIAYAKTKKEGELFYATPGLGSTAHVSTELFKSMTGLKLTHVPYKGSAPALTDLIAGRVQLTIDNLPASLPFAEGGKIRPLAVSTAKRWPLLPDLPAIGEAVPGYEAASWFTIGAPAKTPKEIREKLNASVEKFIKSDDGTAKMRKLGAEPFGGSPEAMQTFVVAEMEKWGKVAQFAGIKPE